MTRRHVFGLVVCGLLAVSAFSACGSQEEATGASVPSMALAGGGTCSVSIIGSVTRSWEQQQTKGTLLVGQWLSATEREAVSLKASEASFIFNCEGDGGSISFMIAANTTEQQFPEAPGEYVIATGGVGASSTPGQISLLVNLHDNSFWSVSEPGTFRITNFGNGKFTGSFEAKLNQATDLSTVSGTATITGTFDLGCTGSRCH